MIQHWAGRCYVFREGTMGMQVTSDHSQPDTTITGPAGPQRAKAFHTLPTWPSLLDCETRLSFSVPKSDLQYVPQQTFTQPRVKLSSSESSVSQIGGVYLAGAGDRSGSLTSNSCDKSMTDAKHKAGFAEPRAFITDILILKKNDHNTAPLTCTEKIANIRPADLTTNYFSF